MGEQAPGADDSRAVFFFDIDNCLYPRSKKIFGLMQDLINKFFVEHLSLSAEDALMLHQRYYQDYGLAILGLVQHNQVDPLEFNRRVDDALPLDDILKPDPGLRTLLETFNREKVKLWLFTNAFVTHGMRVVRLLGVDDLFEGITYCDYAANEIICKPYPSMFEKAEKESGASARETCYFVGTKMTPAQLRLPLTYFR